MASTLSAEYVYGVVDASSTPPRGTTGIAGAPVDAVRFGDVAAIPQRLDNRAAVGAETASGASADGGLERVADVPIYASDAIVRRASLAWTSGGSPWSSTVPA